MASTTVQLEALHHLALRWRKTTLLDAADAAIVKFALRLTIRPGLNTHADVTALRAIGFAPREVHDIVQVTACFAYMNRVADGLGAALEGRKLALARELFGEAALSAHRTRTAEQA